MKRISLLIASLISLLMFRSMAHAEEYQIFDGQTYNNLYYPRIDIIEWGDPLHLEFHVYQKDKPVDVSGIVIKRGGKTVFQFAYDLSYRGERRCRAVPAPPHWKEGQTLKFYSDKSDKDMDRIIVSAEDMKGQDYKAANYDKCVEVAAFSARKEKQEVAETKKSPKKAETPAKNQRQLASSEPEKDKEPSVANEPEKKESEKESFSSDLGGDKDYFWFSK